MNRKVFVAGCGGLGCYCVELLARLDMCDILVADGDKFSISNMNRQLYCTRETIGSYKALQAQERWSEKVTGITEFITEENISSLLSGCCLAVDALDNIPSRRLLASGCERLGIPMVYGAIGSTNSQVCVIYPGDKGVLDILYPSDRAAKITTLSFTPAHCASLQIALAEKILLGESPEGRVLYISDLGSFDFERIKL